jgi:hypothetical protein
MDLLRMRASGIPAWPREGVAGRGTVRLPVLLMLDDAVGQGPRRRPRRVPQDVRASVMTWVNWAGLVAYGAGWFALGVLFGRRCQRGVRVRQGVAG